VSKLPEAIRGVVEANLAARAKELPAGGTHFSIPASQLVAVDRAIATLIEVADGELIEGFRWINRRCVVKSEDFEYQAICLLSFPKSNGKIRYIVEDHGRLFIQKPEQVFFGEDVPNG
jgi:hypothetical protein